MGSRAGSRGRRVCHKNEVGTGRTYLIMRGESREGGEEQDRQILDMAGAEQMRGFRDEWERVEEEGGRLPKIRGKAEQGEWTLGGEGGVRKADIRSGVEEEQRQKTLEMEGVE